MKKLLLFALLACAITASGVAIADSDPVIGTWKLDSSKSKVTGGPAIKGQTRTYSQSGTTISLVMKTMGDDGKEVTTKTSYQLDGKDYPVAGNSDFDSLSAQQVDSHTAKFTLKRNGKPVGMTSRTVSKDGKTMTSKMKVTSASGEESDSVLVFDRQ